MSAPRPRQRECYREITVYSPPVESCALDLSDNTNLWGAPPSALWTINSLAMESIARYPQPYSNVLRERIAEYHGVDPAMIVAGCGSDDIIDSAMRAFAEPGDAVCMPDPTFSMIPYFARTNGLRIVSVPFDSAFGISAEDVLAVGAPIIYLCSPNNPTGTTLARSFIEAVVDGASGVVIIDQAYVDFGGDCLIPLTVSGRVLVVRTMSKAFGLAGLRIGYGVGSPEIVAAVEKARGPYKVNAVAEAAALAALAEDTDWVKGRIREAIENRARFTLELESLGYAPIPSAANFVLVPVRDCAEDVKRLRRAGIAVRAFTNLAGIGDALRISIGPWKMMRQCLDALGSPE